MPKPKGKKARGKQVAPPPAPSRPGPYEVDMTASAEAVYTGFYRKSREAEARGDYANSRCTTFRMVREAIREIIPKDPTNKRYALAGELSNTFRIKKGRLRICWLASSKLRRICILYISESVRKQGDIHDPYRLQELRFDMMGRHGRNA